jgi:HSP20 family protein
MSLEEGVSMARGELSLLSELDRVFDRPFFEPGFAWPTFRSLLKTEGTKWMPEVDVFERDHALVTKIDLPGMKTEDIKVEVTAGHLAISGERKRETEETKGNMYRCERAYGSFYRVVPLPQGVKSEDVKAVFNDGVLEVTMPLPAKPESAARQVPIEGRVGTKAIGAGA